MGTILPKVLASGEFTKTMVEHDGESLDPKFREGTPFEKAVAFTLDPNVEGGYLSPEQAAAQGDPGGETNWGISKRSYPALDIKNLTKEQAAEIYKRDYWDKIQGDKLPEPVSFVLFDYAVNSGYSHAHEELRTALGMSTTGGITPEVLRKANEADPSALTRALLLKRAQFLGVLARKQPNFVKGRMKRIAYNAFVAGRLARAHTAAKQAQEAQAQASPTNVGG